MPIASRIRTGAIVAAYAVSLAVLRRLPSQLPRHWGMPGWAGRYLLAFFLPTFAACLCALLGQFFRREPLPRERLLAGATPEVMLTTAVVFIAALHTLLLATALGAGAWIGRLLALLLGSCLVVVGNVLPRLRPNLAFGVRTPWALRDERAWARTHRVGGYVVVAWGLAIIVTAATAPLLVPVVVLFGALAVVAALAALSYAFSRRRHDALALLCLVAGLLAIPRLTAAEQPVPREEERYFGQKRPGETPEVFAPGIVSTPGLDGVPLFTRDGREAFWSRILGPGHSEIVTSRLENGRWTTPAALPFVRPDMLDVCPALSADERTMVFLSRRPIDGKKPSPAFFFLWTVKRTAAGWGEPAPLPAALR